MFSPLGIKIPKNVFIQNKEEYFAFLKDKYVTGWVVDSKGVNTAGWGLALSTVDMIKIGQLYLNNGIYNDKQIISSKWIHDSTREKSLYKELPYGYLWWIIDDCYAALGDGGNVIFVNPQNKIVVAITSQFMPRAKDRIELIKNKIIPLFN